MPLVDVATAKRELRALDADDADITRRLTAAEEQVTLFLGRNVYVDQDALDAAVAAAPDALAEASTVWQTAVDAALALEVETERTLNQADADSAYRDAQEAYRMTRRGIVVNESIKTAILLIAASLWEHRGDEDGIQGVPPAAERMLWPWRTGIGV